MLTILGLGGLSYYLWTTNQQWVDQNDELRAEAAAMGADLAQTRADADITAASLETVSGQLEQAKATISTLADQDANASDNLDYLEELTDSIVLCVDEQEKLIGYMNESWKYTASSLRNVRDNVNEFCAGVSDAWDEYLEQES